MPHYDYRCEKCSNTFEVFHKMSETPAIKCPVCNSPAQKQIGGGAGIIFKGSGFYKTDYAQGGCSSQSSSNPACASCASGSQHSH